MDKVLVTTPRIGSSMKNREVRENRRQEREGSYDDLPRFSSMKPKSRGWDNRKYLNEYLNPLIRFIKKNCNRPWNKVYSEICNNMDRRSAVKGHIFDHIFDYVCTKPIFENNEPHRVGWNGLRPLYKNGYTFYVDQRGILKEPKRKPPTWRVSKPNPSLIKTDEADVFIIKRDSDGVWFRATMEDWNHDLSDGFCNYRNQPWIDEILSSKKKAVLKTLSKREKRKYGIKQ